MPLYPPRVTEVHPPQSHKILWETLYYYSITLLLLSRNMMWHQLLYIVLFSYMSIDYICCIIVKCALYIMKLYFHRTTQ